MIISVKKVLFSWQKFKSECTTLSKIKKRTKNIRAFVEQEGKVIQNIDLNQQTIELLIIKSEVAEYQDCLVQDL